MESRLPASPAEQQQRRELEQGGQEDEPGQMQPHGNQRQQDGAEGGAHGQAREVFAQQDEPPVCRRKDQGAEPVPVEAKLVGEKLDKHEDRERRHAGGDERFRRRRGNWAWRTKQERSPPKINIDEERTPQRHFYFRRAEQGTEGCQRERGGLFRHGGKAEFEKTAAGSWPGGHCGGGAGRFDSRRGHPAGFTVIKAHRAAIGAAQAERAKAEAAERAEQRGQHAPLGQPLRAERQPERRDELLRGEQLIRIFPVPRRSGAASRSGGGLLAGMMVLPVEDVEIEVGSLAEQDEREGDAHDDGAAAARVAHQRRQPAAQAIGPRRDHEDHAQRQRHQQHHLRAARNHQADGQSHHRGHDQDDAEDKVERGN